MGVLKAIAGFTLVAAIWIGIPFALLYPLALWMAAHTTVSVDVIGNSYALAIALLFLPTGFLVDFLYRKIILKKKNSN